jgi:DNA-binding HxlR family transcriptional regulator
MDSCPLQRALSWIGGKWKLPILCALHQDGATRYNALRRKISGITNTMLSSSLKELEDDGLVRRKQYMEMPLRVEYSLTESSYTLIPILTQLARWGSGADGAVDDAGSISA